MSYKISVRAEPRNDLDEIRKASRISITLRIDDLVDSPEKKGIRLPKPLDAFYHLNVSGQYQITYSINRKLKKVTVVSIRAIF